MKESYKSMSLLRLKLIVEYQFFGMVYPKTTMLVGEFITRDQILKWRNNAKYYFKVNDYKKMKIFYTRRINEIR